MNFFPFWFCREQRCELYSACRLHHDLVPVQQNQGSADGQTRHDNAALSDNKVQRKWNLASSILDLYQMHHNEKLMLGHFCLVVLPTRQTANDFMVICNVAKILELVVPLMEHPSETFLATIEEDLMKLIIKHGMTVCCCCSRLCFALKMSFDVSCY